MIKFRIIQIAGLCLVLTGIAKMAFGGWVIHKAVIA